MFVFFKAPLETFSPIIVMRSYFKVTKPLDPQNKTNIQDLLLLENIYTHFQAFGIKKQTFFHPINIVPVFPCVARLPVSMTRWNAIFSNSYFVSIAALSSLTSSQNETVVRRS